MDYARALQFVVEEKRKIEDSCRELRQQVQRARRNYMAEMMTRSGLVSTTMAKARKESDINETR